MIVIKPGPWMVKWTSRHIYVRLKLLGRWLPLCKRTRRVYRSLVTDAPWVRQGAIMAKLQAMQQEGQR